jgi:uncharacterized cupredoxin-like copper-binding protein
MTSRTPTRWRLATLALGAGLAVAGLSSCGGSSEAADAPVVDVQLGNYTILPNDLTVPSGDVQLRVTNTDAIVHNLTVAGRGTMPLAPGQTQQLSIHTEPGDYRMWCDMPGHAQMGQTGTLHSRLNPQSTAAT